MSEVVTTGDLISAANWNGLAFGTLGYAEVTSNQVGITSETDLTGLSVAVTVEANRRVRISYEGLHDNDTADNRVGVFIKEGTTLLQQAYTHHSEAGGSGRHVGQAMVIITPSSGAHTYKMAMEAPDAGNASLNADAQAPAFILVEDIGST